MAGGKLKPAFFQGAIVLQPVEALDAFVRAAESGNEFVYCEAPSPMYGETWSHAGALAQRGLVRTHERRRPGGGRQYYLVRTARPLPRELSQQEKALGDRAAAIIYVQLKREARLGLPCSSDTELMRRARLTLRQQAGNRLRKLIDAGLIRSEVLYERGVQRRVVTILPGKHAGDAAGKFTALPEKSRALREAAERELRQADDADLDRLRKAGL